MARTSSLAAIEIPRFPRMVPNHTAWTEVAEDEVAGVDGQLVLYRWWLSELVPVPAPAFEQPAQANGQGQM